MLWSRLFWILLMGRGVEMPEAQPFFSEPVSETLLIPLVGRSLADHWHPSFRDPWAKEFLFKIGPLFRGRRESHVTNVIRTSLIDEWAKKFVEEKPHCTVVSLGSGLCTRFKRIDNGKILAFDVDFASVSKLKTEMFPQEPRWNFVSSDVLDPLWLLQLQEKSQGPYLFIIEGLLHYLKHTEVVRLLQRISEKFSGSHLIFDFYHPAAIRFSLTHPKTTRGRIPLFWGAQCLESIARDQLEFHKLREVSLLEYSKKYLKRHRIYSMLPGAHKIYRLAEVRIK